MAPKYTRTIIRTRKAIVERFKDAYRNKIILDGGDPATGVFAGRFTDIARPLNVSSAVVSNVWK